MERWQADLKSLFESEGVDKSGEKKASEVRSHIKKFYSGKVKTVFRKLKKELEKYGREVNVMVGDRSGSIEVNCQGRLELDYKIKVRDIYPYPEALYQDASGNRIWSEGSFREGIEKYNIYDIPEDAILGNFLREYKSRLWALSRQEGLF